MTTVVIGASGRARGVIARGLFARGGRVRAVSRAPDRLAAVRAALAEHAAENRNAWVPRALDWTAPTTGHASLAAWTDGRATAQA